MQQTARPMCPNCRRRGRRVYDPATSDWCVHCSGVVLARQAEDAEDFIEYHEIIDTWDAVD